MSLENPAKLFRILGPVPALRYNRILSRHGAGSIKEQNRMDSSQATSKRRASHRCFWGAIVVLFAAWTTAAVGASSGLILEGLEGELEDNVRAMLGLAGESCDAPRWRIKRRLRNADEQIRAALRALGYYRPQISKQLHWGQDCWQATIEVKPGEPVRVNTLRLDIQGAAAGDEAFRALRKELPIREGMPLHHGQYESLKQRLLSLATERGYFEARYTRARVEVDPDRLSAHIDLAFDSGPRFRIGAIEIGEQPYAASLLNRLVKLKEGQEYSAEALQQTYRSLADSGYFDRVEVTPGIDRLQDGRVPVQIQLEARKRHSYRIGFGLSSDLGPGFSGEYENRRITSTGHQLGLKLSLSTVQSDVGVEYRIPLYESRWHSLNLQGGFSYEDTNETRSDIFTAAARLKGKRGAWSETAFVELQQETSFVEGREFDSLLLMPGLHWERRRVDDLLRPRAGKHVELEVRGAAEGILSDTSFLRAKTRAKYLRPLGKGTGSVRLELGTVQTDAFDQLPTSLRFFAGGDQSVRGYEYESLAPRDADGDLAGGAHLVVASLEYEHPVGKDWGVAVFADTGNAFDAFDEGLKTGVGAGVRWYSPVGPVKVDVGFPQDDVGDSFRIHFSFGTGL